MTTMFLAWRAGRVYKGSDLNKHGDRPSNSLDFGATGMTVSRICLGCITYGSASWREWVLDEAASRPYIKEALE